MIFSFLRSPDQFTLLNYPIENSISSLKRNFIPLLIYHKKPVCQALFKTDSVNTFWRDKIFP